MVSTYNKRFKSFLTPFFNLDIEFELSNPKSIFSVLLPNIISISGILFITFLCVNVFTPSLIIFYLLLVFVNSPDKNREHLG